MHLRNGASLRATMPGLVAVFVFQKHSLKPIAARLTASVRLNKASRITFEPYVAERWHAGDNL
jgi:hypothetical protein